MLMNKLDTIILRAQSERGAGYKTQAPGMTGIPIIVCGDLNSLPDSSVVEFLLNGRIPANHQDLMEHGYEGFLARFSASVRPGMHSPVSKPELMHQFKLKKAYNGQMSFFIASIHTYTHTFTISTIHFLLWIAHGTFFSCFGF